MAKKSNIKTQGSRVLTKAANSINLSEKIKPEPNLIGYPLAWLVLISFIAYAPSLKFGLTELDDSIFIRDFHVYNEQFKNLFLSFNRGLFDALKDPYYRPVFMDSMIINYWLSGHGQNIFLYHLVNIALHSIAVVLLFKLFLKLEIKTLKAFILAAFFAIHPVLTQAVAWIPGRNDTLLAIFVLAFMNHSMRFTSDGTRKNLGWSVLFLLLALFTKETAVFAPAAIMVLYMFFAGYKIANKKLLLQYALWAACLVIWFVARKMATTQNVTYENGFLSELLHRLPLLIQYFGKIILPFDLSVFPTQQETVYYYGIIAIIITIAAIYFSPAKDKMKITGGVIFFVLFLIPALIVPAGLNDQTFEHRLYLPIIGVLLLVPETILFNGKYTEGQVLIYSIVIICITAGKTFSHEQNFSDPNEFWSQAVETSPSSAFANLHLSEYEDNLDKKCALIRKAFQLNPKEKYANFFYAEMLINTNKRDSILISEPYLLTEKGISGFYKCNFYLARVSVERGDNNGAIAYLQEFLKTEPETSKEGSEANNNLLVLYLTTNQINKIVYQARHMKELGLPVPENILQQYHI